MNVPAGMSRGLWLGILAALATWTMAVAWLLCFPCHQLGWNGSQPMQLLCYSDIGLLYGSRGMADGQFAYFSQDPSALLEYPVLQSLVAAVTGQAAHGITGDLPVHAAQSIYFDLNAVLLLVVWLAIVLVVARLVPAPRYALALAVSPAVAATGLINWDLWPVLCAVLALLVLRREHWVLGGALLGLGAAFKLWPFIMLGAVLVLAIRRRRARPAALAFAGAVLAWLVANVPFALADPEQWGHFWSFSGQRGAGFSSVYDVWNRLAGPHLGLEPLTADTINVLAYGAFALLCAVILAVGLLARREPTLEELSLLIVAAFVVTNKVYSPQFVLWLVPLVILARPRLREYAVWQAVEVFHWAVVFSWLFVYIESRPTVETATLVYGAAVALHVLAVLWLCARVVGRLLAGRAEAGRHGPPRPGPPRHRTSRDAGERRGAVESPA